ncbi:uncharacterized protein LOC135166401 isoform X1 [Diachasmimorpha longicaudata]|uniref:uncharacterized protein LOC135166401 isoform X1 n=1 Tax=Diachasmimorpha longicaudata TaxID=58733 RepID=UPI0030B887B2
MVLTTIPAFKNLRKKPNCSLAAPLINALTVVQELLVEHNCFRCFKGSVPTSREYQSYLKKNSLCFFKRNIYIVLTRMESFYYLLDNFWINQYNDCSPALNDGQSIDLRRGLAAQSTKC